MNKLGGYAGNILYVDLGTGHVAKKPMEMDLMKNLLGGSGINAKLTYETVKPFTDPLSPGNSLVFGAGPFVGTLILGAGKTCASTKMPTSGQIDTSTTGSFGKIKFAGYDHLVITGRSDKPVYLKINNDEVGIIDAAHLWGKDVWDTTDDLWNNLGKEYSVMTIGPAGENLVIDASIIGDKYAGFSRGGLGAVMGSKNLKAIAITGTKDIHVAQADQFEKLLSNLRSEFFSQRLLKEWRQLGSLISLKPMARSGLYAYKNYQEAADPEEMISAFDINHFLEIKSGDVACMACPIGCKHFLKLKEGKHAGLALSIGCANAAMQTWGSYCGTLGEWEEIFKSAELCNRLGVDWYNTSSLVAWSIELYQRGIIDKQVTEGLELDWGNTVAIQQLIRKIAYRQGFGDTLAHGLSAAPGIVGKDSQDYVVHIDGLAPPFDPRSRISTESFSQFINVRGGHSSAVTVTMMPRAPGQMKRFAQRTGLPPADAVDRVLTGPEEFNPGRISKWFEDNVSVLDSFGLCQFPPFQRVNLSFWAEMYTALTGIEITVGELLKAGERACNLRNAFNLREGASRETKFMPKRFTSERQKFGAEWREPLQEEYLNQLIDEYHDERGWNLDGTIREEKIKELGLDEYMGDV
ncbi:MAG: hypothetical protein JRI99_03565 [Deltaproteobacteria bacterium]|nr:hypothetical protein [Deltaproteobacteria bacterium]MBW2539791.1 hypothetical protein [Deltaproteobacteria bacterium]